jgi:hypothetical protein
MRFSEQLQIFLYEEKAFDFIMVGNVGFPEYYRPAKDSDEPRPPVPYATALCRITEDYEALVHLFITPGNAGWQKPAHIQ